MMQVVLKQPGEFMLAEGAAPKPGPGEALVRVHRVGVCGTDLHAFAGRQPFFQYPRILGHELGVEVIDPGDDPHGLHAGDRCSVEPYLNCGRCQPCRRGAPNCCVELRVLGVHADGGMRPLLAVPARKLHRSSVLDYDQLALIETLAIGAHAVERARVTPDDFVLVIGAGPIGLGVIQFAQAAGARLAVLDLSAARREFCQRRLGVTHALAGGDGVIEQLREIGRGDLPTAVFDATGNAASMHAAFKLPASAGRLIFVGLVQGDLAFHDPDFHRRELTLFASRNALPGTFRELIRLVETGRLDTKPWITHRMALENVPTEFPALSREPSLIKAMISVPPAAS